MFLGPRGTWKPPLVSWDAIVHLAMEGGLAITRFHDHALLLKLRCVTQLIARSSTAWVEMVGILIKGNLQTGS